VAHVFADFSSKNVFFTEGGIFAAKTVKEPKKHTLQMRKHTLFILFLSLNACLLAQKISPQQLSDAALNLTKDKVQYDGSYFSISYPNGDVPAHKGVCTDVVIRAYRKFGIDLQRLVHEDMTANFAIYPKNWGLKRTDKNIDHRRVPNLQTFFRRKGTTKSISLNPQDYAAGDIVTWDLGKGLTHIGIVTHKKSSDGLRPLIVHNIGNGQELSDCLFSFKITGHCAFQVK
jgi:uncharacterized protein